jgi:hypothetical protein
VSFFARWKLYSEPIFVTLPQAMRVGFTSNTIMPHNSQSLEMQCLKGRTRLSAPLSLCSRLFGGGTVFHLLDLIPSECKFNGQYFVEYVITPLVQTVFPQGRTREAPRLNVHLGNCRIHFLNVTEQFFIENQLFPTHLIVPTWPVGVLDIRAYQDWTRWPKFHRGRRIIQRCSRVSRGNSWCEIDGGFRGLD